MGKTGQQRGVVRRLGEGWWSQQALCLPFIKGTGGPITSWTLEAWFSQQGQRRAPLTSGLAS